MLDEVIYTPPAPAGKRLVRVSTPDGKVVLPTATYQDLIDKLGFKRSDLNHMGYHFMGKRKTLKGYVCTNLGCISGS